MPNTAEAPTLLSVAELAQILRVSRTTAYHLIRTRAVPSVRIGGSIRVPSSALERWLSEREEEALAAVRHGGEAA